MSITENLIYDRTQADVNRWNALKNKGYSAMTDAEKTEWNAGMRGAYTPYIDYNRVETAVKALSELLGALGYDTAMTSKTDWALTDIPTQEDLTRYLDNISKIRSLFTAAESTPAVPLDMSFLTWQEANDIEKILADTEHAIKRMLLSFWNSGESRSGEI